MRGTALTDLQKEEIYKLYLDESHKVSEIAKAYNVDPSVVCKVAKKLGAPLRAPKKTNKGNRKQLKVCPRCKKHIDVKGASFCCFCGADIRSPKELLISRIRSVIGTVRFLPDAHRDEMRNLLLDIEKELSKNDA